MFEQIPQFPADAEQYVLNGVSLVYNKFYDTWAPDSVELPVNVHSGSELEQHFIGASRILILPYGFAENNRLWEQIRFQRNQKINDTQWRYERYARLDRLGLPQIDNIVSLDTYVQALADITKQADPNNVNWPVL